MALLDRILGRKSAPTTTNDVPLVEDWQVRSGWASVNFADPTFDRLAAEGVRANSAVFQCMGALQFKYNEPTPVVKDLNGDPVDRKHPVQALLSRPNASMSHAELMLYIISYKAVGGQCFLHKVRNGGGEVIGLKPYHVGQIRPVPGRFEWVDHYEYGWQRGTPEDIDINDVIHLKWPSVDLERPWMALPPLIAAAQQVDTDSELTRFIYAMLANDAVVRSIITLPAGAPPLTPTQQAALASSFSNRHGGANRGGIGILSGGATLNRAALNMQELAVETIRRIPESRIAGAFRVPAILAGLYVGLEKATYANYGEARSQLTEDTFVPMWASDGQELTQAFEQELDGFTIEYDTHKVAALQENEGERWTRAFAGYTSNALTKNEVRAYIGYGPVGDIEATDEGDRFADGSQPMAKALTAVPVEEKTTPILGYHIEQGVVTRNEARAQLGLPPENESESDKLRRLQATLSVVITAVNAGFDLKDAIALVGMPLPTTIDLEQPGVPPQLTDETMTGDTAPPVKTYPLPSFLVELKAAKTTPIQSAIEKAAAAYLRAEYERAAGLAAALLEEA